MVLVAVKTGEPGVVDIEREAKLAAGMHHPNLAEVFGFDAADEVLCFAMRLVEDRLGEEPDSPRDAHFVCALALAWPDGHVEWFEGRVDGTLVWPPRGDKGHGYDPAFQPIGHDVTFGEMDEALKNDISHRGDAFRQMVAAVF